MRKKFLFGFLLLALAFTLSACGKKESGEIGTLKTIQTVGQMQDIGKDFADAQASGSQEDMARALKKYKDVAKGLEVESFNNTAAVDAPAGLPKELIYQGSKVLEASDQSDENYLDYDITAKTTDAADQVKDYYKNLLGKDPYKISSQKAESNYAEYRAKDKAGHSVSVELSFDTANSKLVQIRVYYSGDK